MLTFLRKIRKSFIDSGSTRKYLLYAIGEILLVMVGILLALQINNWNEARKDRNKEQLIIETVYKELNANQVYLNNRIGYLTDWVEKKGVELIKLTGPRQVKVSTDSISPLLLNAIYQLPYAPIVAQYQQIIGSDEINLIRNDTLKSALRNYQSKLDLASYQQFEMRESIIEYLHSNYSTLNMLKSQSEGIFKNLKNADYSESYFQVDPNDILTDPKFQSMIVTRFEANGFTVSLLNTVLKHIDAMIRFIERNYNFTFKLKPQ